MGTVAVVTGVLSEEQRRTLAALCDTWVPAVDPDGADPVEAQFLARSANELGVAEQIEALMRDSMTGDEIAATAELLDAIAGHDFAARPPADRDAIVREVTASSFDARHALHSLRGLTLLFFYALPDEQGINPNWEALGYPGPSTPPPSSAVAPKTIAVADVSGPAAVLTADVCVVGSGAGGAVIAARCAQAGLSVLVLEMGAYRNESDFKQLEIPGMFELYLGGGLLTSDDGSIAVLAGSTLGGGTVVNYMNCIPTPQHIRDEWAQHGLDGLDAPDYERDHIHAVSERLGANTEMTRQNGTHQLLMRGLDALGLEHRPIVRNASPADDPEFCGYCSMGCQQGCKRSTMKTWLQDASDAGAACVVQCRADRVLTDGNRAIGVAATVTRDDGSVTELTVNAPTVVVACGGVESPALLLRSGIGGPAVGKHLRLHPAYAVNGIYDDPVEGWRGQLQSLVSDSFAGIESGFGFLIEATGIFPGLWSASMPWSDGADHKRQMAKLRFMAPFISVQRDHGSGEVVIDDLGRAVVRWGLDDPVDRRVAVRANMELARLHHAAGAAEIFTLHSDRVVWRRGEDFDAFVSAIERAPYGPLDVTCFTAHQMGACRMGKDPATSVADGRGELHDTKGVWIGDASAFPTAPGVNPMISIMALAHRTAERVVASRRG
jgi:choline dehydrogenase-like flavoprotein